MAAKSRVKRADALFSRQVRAKQRCEAHNKDSVKCKGILQCAHIHSRRYRNTRWDPDNALCLCAAHHMFYTHRPLEWETFIKSFWPERWERTRLKALSLDKVDLDEVLEQLKGEK